MICSVPKWVEELFSADHVIGIEGKFYLLHIGRYKASKKGELKRGFYSSVASSTAAFIAFCALRSTSFDALSATSIELSQLYTDG